jgi:hypothetical protein
MNDRSLEQLLNAWLDAGPTAAPGRVTEAARLEIRSTRQPAALWGWPPRRFPTMNNTLRIALATAAVAVAALLGFNYLVAPNIGSPGLGDPTPTPTPIPILFDEQPDGGELVPGSYLITEVEPFRISITVPEGWQNVRVPGLVWGDEAVLGFWNLDNLYADPCTPASGLLDPAPGPTVDDLVAAFNRVPGVVLSAPTDVTVDRFAAKQADLRFGGSDSCIGQEPMLWPIGSAGDAAPAPAPGEVERLWIVDVNGSRLLIATTDTTDATDEVKAELDAIFESIQIEAP